MMGEIVARNT